MQTRLAGPNHARVAQSLADVGFRSALSLLSTYGGQARDLAAWLAGAQINGDSNLRLQYLAGMGLNTYDNASIYDDMLRYRKFPDNLFAGTDSELQSLREALDTRSPVP
jgi:spermidine synthase